MVGLLKVGGLRVLHVPESTYQGGISVSLRQNWHRSCYPYTCAFGHPRQLALGNGTGHRRGAHFGHRGLL